MQGAISIVRSPFARAIAIIPPQSGSPGGSDSYTNLVETFAHALVTAGAGAAATPSCPGSNPSNMTLALHVQACITDGNRSAGTIIWDADVVILGGAGGGAPQLVIGADGTVLAVSGVQVLDAERRSRSRRRSASRSRCSTGSSR